MKEGMPLVSIITVNYNGKSLLDDCFFSLQALDYPADKIEIIMVDNGSTDGSIEYVKAHFPKVTLVVNDSNNYCRANNKGIAIARGQYIALINNDVKVDKCWLVRSLEVMQSDDSIGAVGSKILFMDGSLESVGHQECPDFYWVDIGFGDKGSATYGAFKQVESICGCSVLYRKKCLDAVGLLDEDFNLYVEDVDMSLRCVKAGWKLVTCQESIIYHKFHGTIKEEKSARNWQEMNRLLLIAKHWPEKLADALHGKGYFTATGDLENPHDIDEVIGQVFVKLVREHGIERAAALAPDLLRGVRRIYNFEKDRLIQEVRSKNETITSKDEEMVLFRRQKEEEIVAVKREADNQLSLFREERDQELAMLKQQQQQEVSSLKEKSAQEYLLLQQKTEEERILAVDAKDKEIFLLREQYGHDLRIINGELQKTQKELGNLYASTGYRYLLRPAWRTLWFIKQAPSRICRIVRSFVDLKKVLLFTRRYSSYFFHIHKNTVPPAPASMILMITRKCNLRCIFCDVPTRAYRSDCMEKDAAFKVIDAAVRLGVKNLDITGGEPLLHPDFFEIVSYAKSCRLKVSVATNGMLVKENLERIKRSGLDSLAISIDGFMQTHNKIRNTETAYSRATEAIDVVKEDAPGLGLSVNFVVTSENVFELEPVYDYFTKKGIRIDFWPVNNQPDLYLKTIPQQKTFIRFVKKLKKKGKITAALYAYYRKSIAYFNDDRMRVRCLGLVDFFGVDVDGSILPCCVWDNKGAGLGNAVDGDLEVLWYSDQFRQARRDILMKGCAHCYNICLAMFYRYFRVDFVVASGPAEEAKDKLPVMAAGSVAVKPNAPATAPSQPLDKPASVLWTSTIRCNSSCLHCDNWKVTPGKELDTRTIKDVISQLHDWLHDFEFIIGGGEPLMRDDLAEVIGFCSKKKIRTTLTTNGTLLDSDLGKKLAASGLSTLNFSLDGLTWRTHDVTRNFPGAARKVMDAIAYMNAGRTLMNMTISTIIMHNNLDEIPALLEYTQKNKLSGIYFLPLMPNFNSLADKHWNKKSDLWPKDYRKVATLIDTLIDFKLAEQKTNTGYSLIINSVHHLDMLKQYYRDPGCSFPEKCTVGRRMFSITEDGHILLCPYEKPLGTIFEKKIADLFYSRKADLLRSAVDACCKNCKILGCYNAE